MPAINDFSDILSAMEQNPELQEAMRNHVLGEELLQLPAVVRQQGELLAQIQNQLMELASALRDTTEQIASYALVSSRVITNTVERLDRVESDLAELKASQARVEASVQDMRATQARMENDISGLKTDMAQVKADVSELKDAQGRMQDTQERMQTSQDRMQDTQERMQTDLERMQASQDRMQDTQERMQGQLNNLTGTDYERKVVKRAPRAARRYLGLRSASVVHGINVSGINDIQALLENATESRSITDEQADELERADLILKGARTSNEEVFTIAEVSITIDDTDVDRARNRANILSAASGLPALAAVIGTAISDANRERANYSGVTVIIMRE